MRTSPALRYSKSLWSYNPLPTGCVFYWPGWNPNVQGVVSKSIDLFGHACTRTGGVAGSKGILMDGNDNVRITNHAAIQACRDVFSAAVWVNSTNEPTGTEVAFGRMDYGANKRTWTIQGTSGVKTGVVAMYSTGAGTISKSYTSSVEPFDNSPHLFGFSYNKPTLTLYMDGVVDASPTKSTDLDASTADTDVDMCVGSALSNGVLANGADSLLGEAWLANVTWTAEEWANLFSQTQGRHL